ncbi:GntR family transcriptional regulator [uncultured Slackia sp.]|uniref:GntR family transcriptional regulator n=1 Tax=uncultured Slackia sp. TaxID=665903 RepID=UPI0025F802BC|nr:GntR family transcriptional regulator [uncultured Slackia sp.]
MILRIDQMSPDPVYQQIRDQIVAAIGRGELLPGDRLPSVRALASDLGINLHTVNKAYAVLRDEGYLFMRGRAGAVVADFQQVASPEKKAAQAERLAGTLYQLALEHCAQGGTEEEFLKEAKSQADRAFADPGVVGTRRDMRVSGRNANGNPLKERGPQEARGISNALGVTPQGV